MTQSLELKANMGYIVFLSAVAAIGGILFGYDTAVISGTTGVVATQFSLNTLQQGWYVGCALIGSIAGVVCAGMLSDHFGRKMTMILSAILFSVSAAGCALCADFQQLVIYRVIGGIGIGIVSIVSPIYISEVAPAEKRGTLVSMYQLAVTVGFLVAYLVNYLILRGATAVDCDGTGLMHKLFASEYWRGMLGCELIPDALFLFVILLIPESPRWLIVKGKRDKAAVVLQRIYAERASVDRQIGETEASLKGEAKSEWKALLEPGILAAVIIGSAIAILGQFMGVNAVLYYGPQIFEDAGLSSGDSLLSQVLVGAVNMLTTVIALFIIDKVGRKKLVYWGVSGMIACLLMISLFFFAGSSLGLGNGFLLTFFLLYVFCTAISISAVVFVLLSEMYPNSVRGLAMSIAGLALWVGTYLVGQLTPWLLENLTPAGTFLLFALMCVPYMLIMWKLVPETTGKTLEEIEAWWRK
ncbi:MAG: sugar porter family MFS transporter [Candidatus Cryptobacteroides sp.]